MWRAYRALPVYNGAEFLVISAESHSRNGDSQCIMRGCDDTYLSIYEEDAPLCPYCVDKLQDEVAGKDLYEEGR